MTLYLKYRPQDFSSLVGQTFIKESLQAAVSWDKTVWAYLFTGPRGTGKTSTARIFAKAINCLEPKNWNPCGKCEICRDFTKGKLIDIIEIDAASYTGVDNIRDIIDKAQYQPTKCRYKVYIIDEVHMLSKWAFNALLKILEEPPVHVKFILATTDIHKVPDTILSRCQRYDFRSISYDDMHARLQFVADTEWVKIDDKSLDFIISEAKGALRNALTLFEQLIENDTIIFSRIEEKLGISSIEEKKIFLEKLLVKDISVLSDYDEFLETWKHPARFMKEILLLLQKNTQISLMAWNEVHQEMKLLIILSELMKELKYSYDEAIIIRIALLRILSWYQWVKMPVTASLQTISLSKNTPKKTHTETQKIQKPVLTPDVSENLDIDTIQDIFWGEEKISTLEENAPINSQKNKSSIDIATLVAEVKKLGAKWEVTMSLKVAGIFYSGTICTIETKTKIARGSLLKEENKTLVLQALQIIHPDIISLTIL